MEMCPYPLPRILVTTPFFHGFPVRDGRPSADVAAAGVPKKVRLTGLEPATLSTTKLLRLVSEDLYGWIQ